LINDVASGMDELVFQQSEDIKNGIKKQFENDPNVKNLFGYSKRKNFGKEFWKVELDTACCKPWTV
jgi:hypothetical protein